ncbi:MAG: glycosyltransferase family 2 protein [Methylococcales bacterium]|nr:glycosyltransferase family 2 protein [Methylococcales bacterium]
MHQDLAMRLSISLVVFQSDPVLLAKTLSSLAASVDAAQAEGVLSDVVLFMIDNAGGMEAQAMRSLLQQHWPYAVELMIAPGNLGFGRGHNQLPASALGDYHLVINPDVNVQRDALSAALAYLYSAPGVGLLTPLCYRPEGGREYLVKRYPSLWVLLLRGFAPAWLKRRCQATLADYECRADAESVAHQQVEIASGCFMLLRCAAWQSVNGFAPDYFMYFEDFDLSLRLRQAGWRIAFVPKVRIQHHGGHAARKGLRHIRYFAVSAIRFFNRHGWRLC